MLNSAFTLELEFMVKHCSSNFFTINMLQSRYIVIIFTVGDKLFNWYGNELKCWNSYKY